MLGSTPQEHHEYLHAHFNKVRATRDEVNPNLPVFALEHGLDLESELAELNKSVREAVAQGSLSETAWLPLVVYATEIGYGYQGDEFWPILANSTPGWLQQGSGRREYVRHQFEKFARAYRGAVPSGRWARWFKNIAWPITHAVLPTDLQRHLARLLFDYRGALTGDLLEDHQALGYRLSLRCQNTSERFKKFAENEALLGLVAAALLQGDEDESNLLSPSALKRIVVDLEREQQAASWLRDAKTAASRVRVRGLVSGSTTAEHETDTPEPSERRWPKLQVELSLRKRGDTWCPYILVPNHSPLAERFPELRDELIRARCRVQGTDGITARGALMYRQSAKPLREWPPAQEPLASVDQASAQLAQILAENCRMPSGPWLFRITEPGVATHVKANLVHPGGDYILLGSDDSVADRAWETIALSTEGVNAIYLAVPETVDEILASELRELAVGVISELEVRPVGLVAAYWDGHGEAHWLAGERPILGIRTSRKDAWCKVETEDLPLSLFSWSQDDSDELFIELSGLSIGDHRVEVTLVEGETEDSPIASGQLHVQILEPTDSAADVGARQGLAVTARPAVPTLQEMWLGSAAIFATGPAGEEVRFSSALLEIEGRGCLAERHFSSTLPVTESRWHELFSSVRGDRAFFDKCDAAEELIVTASNPELGSTRIRTQRPFLPLRWVFKLEREGPSARLISYMDSTAQVEFYDARMPEQSDSPVPDEHDTYRSTHGGLITARCEDCDASLILPPHISGGLDALRRLQVNPDFSSTARTGASVKNLIRAAQLWTEAALPANRNAELLQGRMNNAVVAQLGKLIGGGRWGTVEERTLQNKAISDRDLIEAITHRPSDKVVAATILDQARSPDCEPEEKLEALTNAIISQPVLGNGSVVEFVLRLATLPGTLPSDDEGVSEMIDAVLEEPAIFRLARLFAIASSEHKDQSDQRLMLTEWRWA